MLKQSDAAKLQWFRKMENYYITDNYGKETHAGNQTREASLLKNQAEDL